VACIDKGSRNAKKPSLQAGRAFNAMDQKEKPSTVVEGFTVRSGPKGRTR
jgi:hypothetical protein